MTFAIIKTGGKQYKVAAGDVLKIEKLEAEDGSKVVFDQVLLVDEDGKTTIGTPLVAGAKVTATVAKTALGKKLIVMRYKAKVRYRKAQGHRQPFTEVKIDSIA
jgi:large subunit ribosomal protein L21